MKKQWIVCLLFMVGFLTSCASAPPPPPPPPIVAQTSSKVAGPNESSITIQRTNKFVAGAITMYVYINGEARISLQNGAIGRMVVSNGTHIMELKGYESSAADVSIQIEVNSEAVTYSLDVSHLTGSKLIETDRKKLVNQPAGVEGALTNAAKEILKNVAPKSRIAIVYITAQDKNTTDYVVGELEYILVNEGYFISDRSQLDRLRREQDFGMSEEVDDATAASIGKIAGASVIVTGRVDGEGDLRRLRLRALDTNTAQVVGAASERL
ncbi:hypothetical protein FACS1894164_17190 [Spirochaetia bacterium]|nr:hypothetical protein FACS1894164_17190 [Spirochaetia bacterium]